MILNKLEIKANLSNFYRDYGYSEADIDFFIDLYEEMGQALLDYLKAVKRNQVIRTMETFRRYNFAAFEAHTACYKIETLLSNNASAALAGVSGDIYKRVNDWNYFATDDNKIKMLNSVGKYIQLSAKRVFDKVEPPIISLELYDIQKTKLELGADYLLKDNRIYLLGDAAKASANNASLIAVNIFVDYDSPASLVGSRVGVGYTSAISKPEYRDFIQMVAHAMIKGPTIKNLKDSFNTLAGWENSNIIDLASATGVRKEMWVNPVTAILTPFDFLVTIPASATATVGLDELGNLVANDDRIDIFKLFMNAIKPVDTGYILALSELIVEILSVPDTLATTVSMPVTDDSDAGSEMKPSVVNPQLDTFKHGRLLRKLSYDSEGEYDSQRSYDDDSLVPDSEIELICSALYDDILSADYHLVYGPDYYITSDNNYYLTASLSEKYVTRNAGFPMIFKNLAGESIDFSAQGGVDNCAILIDTDIVPAVGKRVFVYTKVRVVENNCLAIRVNAGNITAEIAGEDIVVTNPIAGQWYELYKIFVLDEQFSGNLRFRIIQEYASAADATGAVCQIYDPTGFAAVDMTSLSETPLTEEDMANFCREGSFFGSKMFEFGLDMYGDVMSIKFIEYPEFPVSFSAVRNLLTGNVAVTFVDNAQSVDGYDIYRNGVVVHSVTPSYGDNRTVSWTDTQIAGLGSGTYVYYARSAYMVGAVKYSSRDSKRITIIK